jgi:hypothetical protein
LGISQSEGNSGTNKYQNGNMQVDSPKQQICKTLEPNGQNHQVKAFQCVASGLLARQGN